MGTGGSTASGEGGSLALLMRSAAEGLVPMDRGLPPPGGGWVQVSSHLHALDRPWREDRLMTITLLSRSNDMQRPAAATPGKEVFCLFFYCGAHAVEPTARPLSVLFCVFLFYFPPNTLLAARRC